MTTFAALVTPAPDGTVTVTATGELDMTSAPELITVLRDAIRRYRPKQVNLDLSGVPFLDSTGIQVLVAAKADVKGGVRITGTSPAVHRLLRMTGLLEEFGVTDNQLATEH
ncbi:STAS domain-containing protein [Dactylosporangium sp. AC04546]|uniref:STAS domain-containing protein n=1 Tax=Dactylosporangium sp. AC04546 TaxID=2862460 RepID=UPI001EDF539C|nr:STAS domain-containing protein [Dactylosporangium sp. AC04546]WVK84361.1 STAS domain-containing protein [Dactylosporangium sp. AC04546]